LSEDSGKPKKLGVSVRQLCVYSGFYCKNDPYGLFINAGGHYTHYRRRIMKKLGIGLVLFFIVVGVSCFAQSNNDAQRIVGTWVDVEGITWVFNADGKLSYANNPGDSREYRYSVFDGERRTELTIFEVTYDMYIALGITDQVYTMEFSKDGKILRLTGAENLNGWSVAGPGWGRNQLTRK
jgi:hypothetical protein